MDCSDPYHLSGSVNLLGVNLPYEFAGVYQHLRLRIDAEWINQLSNEDLIFALRLYAENEEGLRAILEFKHRAADPRDDDSNGHYYSDTCAEQVLALAESDQETCDLAAQALREVQRQRIQERRLRLQETIARQNQPPAPKRYQSGFVYLFRADNGVYKIGWSKEPDKRIEFLGTKLPYELKTICEIASDRAVVLERELKERFAKKRVRGEWFELSEDDVAYVTGLAEREQDG